MARIPVLVAGFGDGPALQAAIEIADADGAEWLALLEPGDTVLANAETLARPAVLAGFDAVFGAVQHAGAIWRPSRLAFDEPERLPHALLHWWVGPPRFIRAATLRGLLRDAPDETEVERLFRLWRNARCIKLAAPLVETLSEPLGLCDAQRAGVIARLDADPVFLPVFHGERVWRLPYTGRNAGIEREQTRGIFFEAAELDYLKQRVGSGARIVDVGANTGNHTVFFAGPMQAGIVLPFEPMPEAGRAIRRAVDANGLRNVDPAWVGTGVGAASARMRAVRSGHGGLGATRLEPDPDGDVAIVRLDDVLTMAPQFLKIDVEGMELEVLRGAQATIAEARPLIFIEIANRNTDAFLAWVALAGYRIERIFSDKGHANYLIAPQGA